MKLKVKIGCDTWKRRIRLKSKVQGSRFEHHCLVGYQQELGDGQGRLKIRNPYLSYPERYFSQLSKEVFGAFGARGICPVYRGTGRGRMWYKAAGTAKGSQKVVLDVTSWEGSEREAGMGSGGGQVGWLHPKLQEMPGGRGREGGT